MEANQQLDALHDIKRMMERSSRFISLSGFSGIAAGICALVGAWLGWQEINNFKAGEGAYTDNSSVLELEKSLIIIAGGVFVGAVLLAFLFTYRRAKKNNLSVWDI
ncbi:MAG: hypothetical protein EOO01_23710, partial [Chitinophagaceae bacterium]